MLKIKSFFASIQRLDRAGQEVLVNQPDEEFRRSEPSIPSIVEENGNCVGAGGHVTSRVTGSTEREVELLRQEVRQLRLELAQTKLTVNQLREREKQMRERLSEQAKRQMERAGGSRFEDLALGRNRPSQLVERYGALYSENRLDALDALDELPEMAELDELKSKLLFSVVVLAFRSVQQSLNVLRSNVSKLLCFPDDAEANSLAAQELEDSVDIYLRKSLHRFDMSSNVQEVCSQLWATLFDYPCLKSCRCLESYVKECIEVSWALCVQTPAYLISYDCTFFNQERHSRFHSADDSSSKIRAVLWPALLDGADGQCVYKAVVLT